MRDAGHPGFHHKMADLTKNDRLGQRLVAEGFLTRAQLQEVARARPQQTRRRSTRCSSARNTSPDGSSSW